MVSEDKTKKSILSHTPLRFLLKQCLYITEKNNNYINKKIRNIHNIHY